MSSIPRFREVAGEARSFFLNELRQARQAAEKDNEAFGQLLFVFERLGGFRLGAPKNLGRYRLCLLDLASRSALAKNLMAGQCAWHSEAEVLYTLVNQARNDALHQGARARHLTEHAIELCLLFEDALMNGDANEANGNPAATVGDIMVRSPTVINEWHPVSFARQIMLTNSFSFLPIQAGGQWKVVSDAGVAIYLRTGTPARNERAKRLGTTIGEAIKCGHLALDEVATASTRDSIAAVMGKLASGGPVLVFSAPTEEYAEGGDPTLVGLLTAFDVL